MACGAHDEIYIQDLNCGVITDEAEVHGLFGADPKTFINTDGSDYEHVVAYKTVDEDFSFIDAETQPWIKDKTTGDTFGRYRTVASWHPDSNGFQVS